MGIITRIINQPIRAATPDNPRFSLQDPGAWEAFMAGVPASAGVNVNRQAALTFPAYWRGVNLVANTIAKLPLWTYERDGIHKKFAPDHPAYKLLRYQPAPDRPETTAFDYKRTKMGHVLVKGNGYSYITRNGDGTPRELTLLDPDKITPMRVNGRLWYVIGVQSENRKLPSEDVIHWKGLGWDGLIGYDVLSYGREVLGLGIALQRYAGKFFGSGGKPSGIIQVPTKMAPPAKAEMLKGWDRMHQGLEQSHRTAILDGGATFNALSIDARNSQLIEERRFAITDIANLLGIRPHKLGDNSKTAYASLEQENQAYLDDDIDPWLIMIESESREKLTSERERDDDSIVIEFDRRQLVRADLAARSAYFRTALAGRPWMTPNEVRAEENMNPDDAEDSDTILTPLNMGKGGGQNAPSDPGGNLPGNPTNNDAELRTALRTSVIDATHRLTKRIGLHARRNASDGKKYLAFLESIETEHGVTAREIMAPALAAAYAFLGLKSKPHVDALFTSLTQGLSALADKTAMRLLPEAVDAYMTDMEATLPVAVANQIFGVDP